MRSDVSLKNSFFKGFFVVSTNPKAAWVWIAVSAYLAPLTLNFSQYLLFGLSVAITAFITFGGYAFFVFRALSGAAVPTVSWLCRNRIRRSIRCYRW